MKSHEFPLPAFEAMAGMLIVVGGLKQIGENSMFELNLYPVEDRFI